MQAETRSLIVTERPRAVVETPPAELSIGDKVSYYFLFAVLTIMEATRAILRGAGALIGNILVETPFAFVIRELEKAAAAID